MLKSSLIQSIPLCGIAGNHYSHFADEENEVEKRYRLDELAKAALGPRFPYPCSRALYLTASMERGTRGVQDRML